MPQSLMVTMNMKLGISVNHTGITGSTRRKLQDEPPGEFEPEFARLRRRHSAVESAINALDRCPDHGIDGFKRYVALAVVARNIHRLGAVVNGSGAP
jgi:hypothetical protein